MTQQDSAPYEYGETPNRCFGEEVVFSGDPNRTAGKCCLEQQLRDDASQKLILHDQRYTDEQSHDDSEQIGPQQLVVLIGRDEEIVEDLFDETQGEDDSKKRQDIVSSSRSGSS